MFRRIAALSVIALLVSVLPSYAGTASSGDVIVVLQNQSGISIKSAGGAANISSVKAFTRSANVNIKQTYDALSEAGGNIFMLVHSDTKSGRELLEDIRSMPGVVGASLNRRVHIMASREPDDPDYYRQWGIQAINAPEVWDDYTGSDNVYVAVIDTGVDYEHEDLAGNISREYSKNFMGNPADISDGHDHGTHCAGIIAALGNNSLGVSGINWKAKIIALKVFDAEGNGSNSDIISAINYVVELMNDHPDMKIAAVNMSLGSYDSFTPEEMRDINSAEWYALKTLSDKNRAVICVAAGNEGLEVGAPSPHDNEDEGYSKGDYIYPASFTGIDNMIVVAAAQQNMTRPFWSNYSSKYADITAPGAVIFSTVRTDDVSDTGYDFQPRTQAYDNMSGTSMATPHVAGVAALLKSIYPNAAASSIKAAILGGADSSYFTGGTSRHGLLDVKAAVDFLASDGAPAISVIDAPEGTVNQPYNFELYASGSQPITWEIEGTLPEGLSFSGGKITGTPQSSGENSVIITAQNSDGTDSVYITLNVNPATPPAITTQKLDDAVVNKPYSVLFDAEGSWPMEWTITTSRMQGSMTVDEKAGRFICVPTRTGTYNIDVTVKNSAGQNTKTFSLNVRNAEGDTPRITTDKLIHGTLNRRYGTNTISDVEDAAIGLIDGVKITAEGAEPIIWRITGGKLPDWLELDASTGTIYGIPQKLGASQFTVEARNEFGSDTKTFTISVDTVAPEFAGRKATVIMQKGVYSSHRIITSGTAPVAFRTEGDSMPSGVSAASSDCTYIIHGRPEETGTYNFTVYGDNISGTASIDVVLKVSEPAVITSYYLPDAVKGKYYSRKINTLGDANVSFTWTSGDLPTNVRVSSAGEVAGTPSVTGRFIFTVKASSDYASSEQDILLNVIELPEITASSLPNGRVNSTYPTTMLQATGDVTSWAVSGGKFPAGLVLSSNGYIYGTPTSADTYSFTVSAMNSAGTASKDFTVNITASTSNDGNNGGGENGQDTETEITLPSNAITITRIRNNDISSLTVRQLNTVSTDNSMVAAVLDEFTANDTGIYQFRSIDILPEVSTGWTLVWHPFPYSAAGVQSSGADDTAIFLDSADNEIYAVPRDHKVGVDAHVDAGTTYAPVIAAVKPNEGSGPSSGGCNETYGAVMLAVLLLLKKRR